MTAQQIQEAIFRGEFPPGSPLPEIPLSRRLEVSRGVIREALRGLADGGLVVISPRHGAQVSPVSPKLVHEVYSLRAVLETFAVKLAITSGRVHGEAASTVENAYQSLAAAAEQNDKLALVEADMAFHWAVCSPCGHELLLEHLKQLQVRTRLCILFTKVYSTDAESEALSHRPILNAILASDLDRAETALRDHLLMAGQRLLVRLLESEPHKTKRSLRSKLNVGN
ncbi:DNA-binding GntR family transcriptional regulator [Rhodoligotrophos appendicifer]|uniref:GntR family transcriptional regulator n=1 Tax=Rhodoligotrophos appendicifer TaxID=987056 RepID=UPI001479286C|nr:GntR family transcriptional regulator [Rhodoligotrophos appendicifer]